LSVAVVHSQLLLHFIWLGAKSLWVSARRLHGGVFSLVHSILIVEDDIEQLEVLREILEVAGYSTRCAQNGKEA
jgi:hypothetical protein